MVAFRFTNEHSSSGIADIVGVLRQPRLWIPTHKDYPDHHEWLDRAEAQIASGTKRAMAAYIGKEAVGTILYQRQPDAPKILEIRNISVSPDARGRYIGAFLLRNAELEAANNDFPDIQKIVVDTKATNTEMIQFLLSQHYRVKAVTDLYGLDAGADVVLEKRLAE